MKLRQYTGAPTRYFGFERLEHEITVDILAQFISENVDSIETNEITIPATQFISYITEDYIERLQNANQIPNQITQEIEKSISERILSALKLDFADTKEIKVNNPDITPETLTLKIQYWEFRLKRERLLSEGIQYLTNNSFITILNQNQEKIDELKDAETIIINQKLLERL